MVDWNKSYNLSDLFMGKNWNWQVGLGIGSFTFLWGMGLIGVPSPIPTSTVRRSCEDALRTLRPGIQFVDFSVTDRSVDSVTGFGNWSRSGERGLYGCMGNLVRGEYQFQVVIN